MMSLSSLNLLLCSCLFVYVCCNPNANVSEITSCDVCDRLDLHGGAGAGAWVREHENLFSFDLF
jgi:hypothetical protein